MKQILILFIIFIITISCGTETANTRQLKFRDNQQIVSYDENMEINSYFSPFDRPDLIVLQVLDNAQKEILIAHYNIRKQSILEKLVELSGKGIKIRIVVDRNNAYKDYNTGDDFLEENGIEIIRMSPSRNGSLMHLKSAVIDRQVIITGSYNWSDTATFANNENMLVINNAMVAEKYSNEILELLDGNRVTEGGKIDDTFEVHYSPEENLYKIINRELSKARTSIDIAMFTFTKLNIARKLESAINRGVKVRVIMEKKQFKYSEIDEYLKRFPQILFIEAANKVTPYSAMHNKYVIIDNKEVITGASNWTTNGTTRSEEDILIIRNSELALKYTQNFNDLLNIYGNINENFYNEPVRDKSPVMFHIINNQTSYGDRIFITGNTEELGNWNPSMGVEAFTSESMFPNWGASAYLPTRRNIEYKIVIIGTDNSVKWETGSNRMTYIPETGRAVFTSNTYRK